jgi:3-oxoacyl-[acyl-carrier protein] reductase
MDLKLNGKVAAISGASRGIGLACAHSMGKEGMRLSICARNPTTLETANENLRAQGFEVLAISSDVSKKEDLEQWLRKTSEVFGSIDVLVNNAGEGPRGPDATSDEGWQIHFEQYVMSAIHACNAVVPIMKTHKGGCIINISSVAGIEPATVSPIAVTKAAINNYSIGLGKQLAKDSIRVISVCPGLVWSKDRIMAPGGVAEKLAKTYNLSPEDALNRYAHENIPLGRLVTTDEVAHLVCLLASNAILGSLTATVVTIDGGVGRSLLP